MGTRRVVNSYLQSYIDSCCSEIQLLFRFLASVSEATCCLLEVTGFDLDTITADIHPTYSFRESYWEENAEAETSDSSDDIDSDDRDFTNYSFPTAIWNQRKDWEITVKSVAVAPIVLVAVIGNLSVIRIILKARLFRHPINMFILNMSVADLLCSLLFPWIILVGDLYQSFMLGEFICKTEGFVLVTLMLASVFSLTSISYDRLMAVVFPFRPRMDRKRAKWIIWFVWIAAMASASPLIFWRSYHERFWKDFHEKWCKEDKEALKLYWFILLVFLVWIPLTILFLTYTAILTKLDTLERRQKEHPAQVKKKSKVVRMLFGIVILFTICWSPFTGFTYTRYQMSSEETNPPWLRHWLFVSHYLMFVNCAVNPIIYGLKNDNLKREMHLALPAFMRAKVSCEISAVHKPDNQNGILKNRHYINSDNQKQNEKNCRPSLTSSYDKSPASIISLQRRNSALEDVGIVVSSINLTKLTYTD